MTDDVEVKLARKLESLNIERYEDNGSILTILERACILAERHGKLSDLQGIKATKNYIAGFLLASSLFSLVGAVGAYDYADMGTFTSYAVICIMSTIMSALLIMIKTDGENVNTKTD
jgi:hypothetical protein